MALPVAVEQRAQAKVKVLPVPVALPHKCASCGCSTNEDGRAFYDFGINVNYYGVIYVCTECIVGLMNDVGWVSPAQHQAVVDKLQEVSSDNLNLRGKVVAYGNALSSAITADQLDLVGLSVDDTESSSAPVSGNRKSEPSDAKSGPANVSAIKSSHDPIIKL